MKIMAIESSALTASAAVVETGGGRAVILGAANLTAGRSSHSVTLLPLLDSLLRPLGMTAADADAFACAAGPGSFTGVRIGVSLLKGLAFGTGKPCVGVSSLEALAYPLRQLCGFAGSPDSAPVICPVMDARRGQLYNALFARESRLTPDRLIPAEELYAELCADGHAVLLCGDGADKAGEIFASLGGGVKAAPVPDALRIQSALSVALLASEKLAAAAVNADTENAVRSCDTLAPIYLRPSQAERERNASL